MTLVDPAIPRADEDDASELPQVASVRGVYIGVDATNPTLILRIRSFRRAGVRLTSFTFRRHKFNTGFQPDWVNIHLGDTVDRRYLYRLPALLRALRRMVKHGDVFRDADFIYARNLDLLALGHFARLLTGSKAKLVYEVEDVQAIFFKKTTAGALFRRLEGWLLNRVDLLVVMSPGFLRGYFEPVHGWKGPSFVLENKLQLGGRPETPTPAGRVWEEITDRWVIGWFGTLRCTKSMALLEEIAVALGPRVHGPWALGPWAHGLWPVSSWLLTFELFGPWHLARGPWPLARGPWPLGPGRKGLGREGFVRAVSGDLNVGK